MTEPLPAPPPEPPIERVVLRALAREMEILSGHSSTLQALVTRVLGASVVDPEALEDVQAADLIAQTLVELTRFLDQVLRAPSTPELLANSIDKVVLGDLSNRLLLNCLGENRTSSSQSGVELF